MSLYNTFYKHGIFSSVSSDAADETFSLNSPLNTGIYQHEL